jgi:16S rRNA (cytosine1402-N4)-methyltransferase
MHISVLLKEVLEYLNPKPNENFIDCTVGGSGHAFAILKQTAPNGKVLGIDLDSEILKKIKRKAQSTEYKNRLILANDSFANLKNIIEENHFKPVQGILLDLGFSSWQMDESGRGFSFKKDEPLIMKYDKQAKSQKPKAKSSNQKSKISFDKFRTTSIINQNFTAEYVVNVFPEKELVKIFQEYGEERFSRRIAKKICEQRKIKAIKTTFQLVEVIRQAIPARFWHQKIHFATRVFQSLRIAVNDELNNIKKVLPQAIEVLEPSGKITVISFHSLEDRIVKQFFKEQSKIGRLKIITKKPVVPTSEEIEKNPRSRSAKMRVAMKI